MNPNSPEVMHISQMKYEVTQGPCRACRNGQSRCLGGIQRPDDLRCRADALDAEFGVHGYASEWRKATQASYEGSISEAKASANVGAAASFGDSSAAVPSGHGRAKVESIG